jgi:hypothetical protein
MENPFLKTLQTSQQQKKPQKPNPDWDLAFDVLKQFMQGIQEFVDNKVICSATPGFTLTIGQEWRIVLSPAAKPSFAWVLLRVYLLPDGFPVTLNVYNDELLECKKLADLRKALMEYLENPNVQESIRSLAAMK